jgi:hypothetical protein
MVQEVTLKDQNDQLQIIDQLDYHTLFCHHPLINPIVNPADMLPVNGMPKLVIANEEAIAAVWLLSILLLPLKPGICVIRLASIVSAPSDTV